MQTLGTTFLFVLLLIVHIASLLFNISEMSIHHTEAFGFFYDKSLLFDVARWSYETFGYNDFALRAPFLALHTLNVCLLYAISRIYLKKPIDSLLCVFTFMMLPGVVFSSVLISKATIIMSIALICVYWQLRFKRNAYLLPAISVFLDAGCSVLFLGMFFYALRHKNTQYMVFALVCFAINMNLFGINVSGHPQSYFVDTLGGLIFLFSPLLLAYYIYSLIYSLKRYDDFMSYVSVSAIVFVLILSLRQKVDIETLIPMSVVGLPVLIKRFLSDIRVRLPQFRRGYVVRLVCIIAFACMQTGVLYANKLVYLLDVKSHFAKSYYYGKDLAHKLKAMGIRAIQTQDKRLELQLRFYGISNNASKMLRPTTNCVHYDVSIEYLGKIIACYEIIQAPQSVRQNPQSPH
ncbi:hypothetical protein [uncultured Helicobacter sp.]|uniref:hypothetical protein n=1 Tax=uncultured Helicobacter sp. TaxID=175537 RepID=UPI001C3B5673|nr:hypothetical protein [Candidatus Helicobacter avicola]